MLRAFRRAVSGRARVLAGAYDDLLACWARCGRRPTVTGTAHSPLRSPAPIATPSSPLSASGPPTVRAIEDAHWADEATRPTAAPSSGTCCPGWRCSPCAATGARAAAAVDRARPGQGPGRAARRAAPARRPGGAVPRLPRRVRGGVARRPRGRGRRLGPRRRPYEQARAALDADTTAPVLDALTVLDGLGARAVAAVARRRLRRLGHHQVPRGPRTSTRAHPAGLTERQGQILALLGPGCPTRRSHKGHHVSTMLAKLGVATRGRRPPPRRRSTCRSAAYPEPQVEHPVALDDHVRVLQQVLAVDRPK